LAGDDVVVAEAAALAVALAGDPNAVVVARGAGGGNLGGPKTPATGGENTSFLGIGGVAGDDAESERAEISIFELHDDDDDNDVEDAVCDA
jgi:hypothetical protein